MLSPEKLKYLRLLHSCTQKEIATEMGITKNYISMIENRKESYSQEWCDKYIKAVYIVAEEKKKITNDEVVEIIEDVKNVVKNK